MKKILLLGIVIIACFAVFSCSNSTQDRIDSLNSASSRLQDAMEQTQRNIDILESYR